MENHHNFAWKGTHAGRQVIVHRKGATPAACGGLGMIPGSMGRHSYAMHMKDILEQAAAEAAPTAERLGARVERISDVGVAVLHRLGHRSGRTHGSVEEGHFRLCGGGHGNESGRDGA